MTRINCVPVEELSRQHLLAEWRELPRVFKLAANAYASGKKIIAPETYTLGEGHVKFFYKRLGFISERFYQLRNEMLRRGYEPSFAAVPFFNVPEGWFIGWKPDEKALEINRARIAERNSKIPLAQK